MRGRCVLAALSCLAVLAGSAAAQEHPRDPHRCASGIPQSEANGFTVLPHGNVFCPLLADPKAPRSFASVLRVSNDDSIKTMAAVGIGDAFGSLRWGSSGNGLQLGIEGAVFAQFDLEAPSSDLLNADYVVGLPVTMRAGAVSGRLRLYHQSSHLGDEFLLRSRHPERENISFEAMDAILSVDAGGLRVYGGGEVILHTSTALAKRVVHGGAELRPAFEVIPLGSLGTTRFVAAADIKASEENDWKRSTSLRAGLEFDRAREVGPPPRRWALLAEWYDGPSPYGQFFRTQLRYVGIGAHFMF